MPIKFYLLDPSTTSEGGGIRFQLKAFDTFPKVAISQDSQHQALFLKLFKKVFLWPKKKKLSWSDFLEAVITAPIFLDICL